MIDFGLVVSLIAAIGVPALLASRLAPQDDIGSSFLDEVTTPILVGLVGGRLVTLALDDPNSIGSLSDMLVIRSGVEFWPGAAAAACVVAWQATRAGDSPLRRLAVLAPLALVGYAAYEAACVFRDGCLGPLSPVGLRPPGLQATMLPVGWLMAGGILVGSVIVHRLQDRFRPTVVVGATLVIVAGVRAVGSIWLPHIGHGLTRQHLTSVVVLVVATAALGAAISRNTRTTEPLVPDG